MLTTRSVLLSFLMVALSLQRMHVAAQVCDASNTAGECKAQQPDEDSVFRPSLDEELASPDSKRALNLVIFSRIAKEYDFMTKALSFGQDASWKRHLVAKASESLTVKEGLVTVDLACGTGEITNMVADAFPGSRVRGIDLTPGMIELAKQAQQGRKSKSDVSFFVGDMTNLTIVEDSSVDLVTGGYAIRNAPDLKKALKEIHRILKPGGRAAFLDFSRSHVPILSSMGYWALKIWGGFWGTVMHGKPWVYGYIADSLESFPDRKELAVQMEEAGLPITHRSLHMFGLLETVHMQKVEP